MSHTRCRRGPSCPVHGFFGHMLWWLQAAAPVRPSPWYWTELAVRDALEWIQS